MTPYETYLTYLALKRHFTKESYDFKKYRGKKRITASIDAFHKRRDRFFFERLSRQKKKEEIIDFFVSNFVHCTDPGKLWIGEIAATGSNVYQKWKTKIESLSYVFEQDLRKIAEDQNIVRYVSLDGSRHPQILKDYLADKIQFETLIITLSVLNLLEKYDQALTDPVWQQISLKIRKYIPFLNCNFANYEKLIRKIFL